MWKHILCDQLDMAEPEFWTCVAALSRDEAVARLQGYWTRKPGA
ncbi:MAG TPA: hypothetical protein VH352_01405 [Pseudonocardiaceae bacterium]|jgi:hypothetical protein|nr:hypothetical protein [Pseudonocardiaceae bacterium]